MAEILIAAAGGQGTRIASALGGHKADDRERFCIALIAFNSQFFDMLLAKVPGEAPQRGREFETAQAAEEFLERQTAIFVFC